MPSSAPPKELSQLRPRPADRRFRVWLLRQQPISSCLALGTFVVAGAITAILSDSSFSGCLVILTLLAASWQIWLPMRYDLNGRGIQRTVLRHATRVRWAEIQACEVRRTGVQLVTSRDRTLLGFSRGLHISFGSHRNELMGLLDHYVTRPRHGENGGVTSSP